MKIHGRCYCGRIFYEAEIDPKNVIVCHCTDCQTISGAPCRANVPVAASAFTLHGTPKTYVKTAASGNRLALAFCADCGTSLFSSALEKPRVYNLRLGAVAERAELAPRAQYWCQSAMPWVMELGALPRAEQQGHAQP